MGAWVRRMAVVVVLAVIASTAGVSPAASAQAAPPPAAGKAAEPLTPEVFKPGQANAGQAPGSAIPADGLPGDDGLSAVGEPGEVVERRTEDSTTFLTDDGKFETTFYGGPVHYRDANGDFQPIDNTLVPADKPGALRNKAGAVEVTLPVTIQVVRRR